MCLFKSRVNKLLTAAKGVEGGLEGQGGEVEVVTMRIIINIIRNSQKHYLTSAVLLPLK